MKQNLITKTSHLLWSMGFLCLCAGLLMTGCSDDDDETENGGSSNTDTTSDPGIFAVNGTSYRLTKAGDWYAFEYASDGTLSAINDYDNDEKLTVTSSPFAMSSTSYKLSNFSFNSNGYVTKVTNTYDEIDDDDYEAKGSITATFSYNSEGQVVKIEVSDAGTIYDYDDTYKYTETDTHTYTYTSGNLSKVTSKYTVKLDGETSVSSATLDITAGDVDNPCMQITRGQIEEMDLWGYFDHLAFLGLLGKGSKQFPAKIVYSEVDASGNKNSETCTYTYKVANDLLSQERTNSGSWFSYSYTKSTRAEIASDELSTENTRRHSIRRRLLQRK